MSKNIIKKTLCYILTLCLVFGSMGVIPASADVNSDKAKAFDIIDAINAGNRRGIVDEVGAYLGISGYPDRSKPDPMDPTKKIPYSADDCAAKLHQMVNRPDLLSFSSIKTGLLGIKAVYIWKGAFVEQGLQKLFDPNGFPNYTAPANIAAINKIIVDNAKSFKIFMNALDQIKIFNGNTIFLTSQNNNIAYTSAITTHYNKLLDLAKNNQNVKDRIIAYKTLLDTLIQQVNTADAAQRSIFVNYLKDQNLLQIIPVGGGDNDGGSSGGSGGGGGAGGGAPTTPTAPVVVTPPTTPGQPAAPVTVKVPAPAVNNAGQAKVQVTAQTMQTAMTAATVNAQGVKQVAIEVPAVAAAKSIAVEIPSDILVKQAVTEVVQIKTNLGTVELPSNMLGDNAVGAGKTVALTIGKVDTAALAPELQAKIGTRPVVELNIKVNGEAKEWSSDKASVKVALDYTPTAEELANPENIVVYYIDGKGNAVEVPNGRYDGRTGKVVFNVTHFSKYAVAYVKKSFTDLDKHLWAKKQIEIMASKGIIKEATATTFNPAGNITRAEFIYGLVSSLGLSAKADTNFSDVKTGDYYYNEVAIAKKLGIVSGVGGDKFLPASDISRQEMMVMTVRALKAAGKIDTANKADLGKYTDNAKISAYAKDGVANLISSGIIEGSGNKINPQGKVTRAEGAVIMYRVYHK